MSPVPAYGQWMVDSGWFRGMEEGGRPG